MRQEEAMAKEAMYSSQRMRSRIAASNENVRSYAASDEADQAMYLRRKMEQGKRMPPQPTPGATPKPTPKP
jgi:hypothetical protein